MLQVLNIYSDDLIVFEGSIDGEFYDSSSFLEDALDDIFDGHYRISNKKNFKVKKDLEDDYGVKEIWSGSYENKKIVKGKVIMRGLISSRLAERLIDAFADTYGIFFYGNELYIEDANVFLDSVNLVEERVNDLMEYFDYKGKCSEAEMLNAICDYVEGRS